MTPSEERYIFTTLRFDDALRASPDNTKASGGLVSSVYLLDAHLSRLREAVEGVARTCAALQQRFCDAATFEQSVSGAIQEWKQSNESEPDGAFRVRCRYHLDGYFAVDIAMVQRIPSNHLFPQSLDCPEEHDVAEWTVVIDSQATSPTSATIFKTSERDDYNRARKDAGITSLSAKMEVLLYNPDGDIIDASISTPYFYREGCWVTPAVHCGGQRGASRRWALDSKLCVEGVISKDSLRSGEKVWFSNALRGFFAATLDDRAVASLTG